MNKDGGGKSNIYMWTTFIYFLLMLITAFNAVVGVVTFHFIQTLYSGVAVVFWGFLFKWNLKRFTEVEQSLGR